jgi:hypothetical protein
MANEKPEAQLANLSFNEDRKEDARRAYGEALTIYEELGKRDSKRFSVEVASLRRLLVATNQ